MLENMSGLDVRSGVKEVRAKAAILASLSDEGRSELLENMEKALYDEREHILSANQKDLEKAKKEGVSDALLHRLELSPSKLEGAIESVRSVRSLPSPLGKVRRKCLLDEGLVLEQVTYPLGVIGMIFEARPDAMIQIISLAIRSGNGIILKGGKEAFFTNSAIAEALKRHLDGALWMLLLESHDDVDEMLKMEGDIDLLIPRGSNRFVRYVMDHTHIPVLGHADGICAVYIDEAADMEKALRVAVDSKVQYPAACNAAETILVHEKVAKEFIPRFKTELDKYGVKIHGDEKTAKLIDCIEATEADYHTEYLALELAIKVVSSFDEATDHIASHGSHHTDAIVTESEEAKEKFFKSVDSADVFCNASTRFADGFRFGLGAEVGISTSKIHARGPVGLEGLVTTRYLLTGSGDIVADYSGKNAKRYIHKDLL